MLIIAHVMTVIWPVAYVLVAYVFVLFTNEVSTCAWNLIGQPEQP
jgi:hypothetical protein